LLRQEGGVFDIGTEVDLGAVRPVGRAPETEDHIFNPANLRAITKLIPEQFWETITKPARMSLAEIFGPDLHHIGNGFAVSVNQGAASLGCLRMNTPVELIIANFDGRDTLKLHGAGTDGEFWLAVTDIRLYKQDQRTLNIAEIDRINELLQSEKDVILSVGLARSWQKPGDEEKRHWLQLNNIHLKSCPIG
jgi:hypothetical protein